MGPFLPFCFFLSQVKYCSENNKRLIHFSTCEVYGKTVGSFLPKDHPLRQVSLLLTRIQFPIISIYHFHLTICQNCSGYSRSWFLNMAALYHWIVSFLKCLDLNITWNNMALICKIVSGIFQIKNSIVKSYGLKWFTA